MLLRKTELPLAVKHCMSAPRGNKTSNRSEIATDQTVQYSITVHSKILRLVLFGGKLKAHIAVRGLYEHAMSLTACGKLHVRSKPKARA